MATISGASKGTQITLTKISMQESPPFGDITNYNTTEGATLTVPWTAAVTILITRVLMQ